MDRYGVQGLVERPTSHEFRIDPTIIGDVLYTTYFFYNFQTVHPFTINQLYSDLMSGNSSLLLTKKMMVFVNKMPNYLC
jgi:hypothetical protein